MFLWRVGYEDQLGGIGNCYKDPSWQGLVPVQELAAASGNIASPGGSALTTCGTKQAKQEGNSESRRATSHLALASMRRLPG